MDLSDVWEQNKRWILGVVAGIVLFFVGTSLIRSFYDGAAAERIAGSHASKVNNKRYYNQKARKQAREAGEALA